MSANRQSLQILAVIVILTLLAMVVVYNAGRSRGQLGMRQELLTAQAELAAVPTSTPTPVSTPTETWTPTSTYTPTPSRTPTHTPTPTSTPASPEEWAERFRLLSEEGLNTIAAGDLSGERAESLLRGIAREQGLLYVPATYSELDASEWAALVVPRTPQGEALPMLFWREPNDRNRIRSQDLLGVLSASGEAGGYGKLLAGLSYGAIRSDLYGKLHALFVERTELGSNLHATVIMQQRPAGDFLPLWDSADDPLWEFGSAGSQLQILEANGHVLPDLQVIAPLAAGGILRRQVGAPSGFVEEPPFARQWAASLWRFRTVEQARESAGGVEPGYALEDATLIATPLTALAELLDGLRSSDLSGASNYVNRLDLLQEAYDLGLHQPGAWVGAYLDDDRRELAGGDVSHLVQFFDNGDRQRTYVAEFDQDADGAYRLASVVQAPAATGSDSLTPAAPLATLTFTPNPTNTPIPTDTPIALSSDAQGATAALPPSTATLLPTPIPTNTASATPLPTATASPTNSPAPTFTLTPSATPTFTVSPTPTPTSTATPTFTATPTPTESATATPTERPYRVVEIPTEQAPLARGSVVKWPANLRTAPNTTSTTIIQLSNGVNVDLFGITEDGLWSLLRVDSPGDEGHGEIGWIATDLLSIGGGRAFLTKYRADGTPVVPPTATFTPTLGTPTPTYTVAPTLTPTPTLSPTPRPTPVIAAAVSEPMAELVAPPPGEADNLLTIRSDEEDVPGVNAIPAVDVEGRNWTVSAGTAAIEIWSGLFGAFPAEWVPAPAGLLRPGVTLHVQGAPGAGDGSILSATRVRIAAAPAQERARLVARPELAGSVAAGTAVALIGSREEAGVYLLETAGTLRQLWIDEREATWAGSDPSAGVIVSSGDPLTGSASFTWVRGDGIGLQVNAQPYHDLRGVVGDVYGGLWWIETPQADVDQWQLWHYDAAQGRIILRLRGSGAAFQNGNAPVTGQLTPVLLSVQPELGDAGQVVSATLLVDTVDTAAQQLYQGVFRMQVSLDETGAGHVSGRPQLLMARSMYRGPLQVSPDGGKLAHFVYDADHPSLTSGVIRPPNTVRVLILEGRGANTSRTVYATENRFEFMAPNLNWQGNNRLVVARSRFAAGDTFGVDRFGIVLVELPDPEQPSGDIKHTSYLFPNQNQLRDFAVCADGLYTLTITSNGTGVLELARWNGADTPQALFALPEAMSRGFLCWHAPDELVASP